MRVRPWDALDAISTGTNPDGELVWCVPTRNGERFGSALARALNVDELALRAFLLSNPRESRDPLQNRPRSVTMGSDRITP